MFHKSEMQANPGMPAPTETSFTRCSGSTRGASLPTVETSSTRSLQAQLGLRSYKSAWLLLHKAAPRLVDPDRLPLAELVEVDVLENPPVRLPGAAAIFTAGAAGIPLALTHHIRHNRVLHAVRPKCRLNGC
jgi:hypothetical protein